MQYVNVSSARRALNVLLHTENAKIIAGGTDVMVDYKLGKLSPACLVDISKATDMNTIEIKEGYMTIGAVVTLTDLVHSVKVNTQFPSLAKGAGVVGSTQIRNSATLVGNVVTAQPAADAAMAVSVLDPAFTVLSAAGVREVTMTDMYAGFGKSTVDPSRELVTQVKIPLLEADEAAAFETLELRRSLSLPMLSTAAMVKLVDGKIAKVRISMAPVGVGPVRAAVAEEYLLGKEPTYEVLKKAGELALENANPRSNPLRGSREFRIDTLPVMVRRALEECCRQIAERKVEK